MPTAVIEVKFVNQPKLNPDFGSVRAADGNYYGVHKLKLPSFREGGVYEVFYEETEGKGKHAGKTFKTIQTFKAHESQTAPAAGKVLAQAERARTPESESKQIWTCALLVAAIKAGQVNILEGSQLYEAVENAVGARDVLLGGKPAAAPKTNSQTASGPDADMDDQIPF